MPQKVSCVIVPGANAEKILYPSDSPYVITYGMDAKDTISCSSIGGDRLIVDVSREINTVRDEIVETQELALTVNEGSDISVILAAVGCLLYAGVDPQAINGISFSETR